MNKQGNKEKPSGGIEWTHIFGPGTGFTVNPVRGCEHDCKWEMPDGHIVACYAKSQRERLSGPGSFEKLTFHPEMLQAIKRQQQPAGIFIDSMSDLFGQHVNREWIDAVIDCIRDCPQHEFFSLTKNPSRFREFTQPWPANWLVGISAPPTFMFGRRLTPSQQNAWLHKGLDFLHESPARKRWLSAEPLSFDITPTLRDSRCTLDWLVVGAGSDGSRTYQPNKDDFRNLLAFVECPVFFKGNLCKKLADEVAGGWMAAFPLCD